MKSIRRSSSITHSPKKHINFLDSKVSIIANRLSTSVFTKPTDRKAYLHSNSYHPKSTKEAIAFGQATRLRRICTEEAEFHAAADRLKNDLISRGYEKEKIMAEYYSVKTLN